MAVQLRVWVAAAAAAAVYLVGTGSVAAFPRTIPESAKTARNGFCGGQVHLAAGKSVSFTSPGYDTPYPVRCSWAATSPANTVIRLSCPYFSILSSPHCSVDAFLVYTSSSGVYGPFRYFCGSSSGGIDITTDGNQFYATYAAKSYFSYTYPGFYCTLTAEEREEPVPTTAPTTSPVTSPTTAPSAVVGTCGIKVPSRIVGGEDADEEEWPWQVAVRLISTGDIFCGAVLISDQWVVTAAHCAEHSSDIFVSLGFHNVNNAEFIEHRAVVDIIIHEHYDRTTVDNDIALLRMRSPVSYSASIRPVCLPCELVSYDLSGKTGTVTGWGDTTGEGTTSPVLKEVDLPILTTSECQRYLHGNVTNNMICTYSPGQDACQGDSGGPLTLARKQHHYLVGIVSFGFGCAEVNSPGVYTKVTNYLQWIGQKTSVTFCS